MDEVQDLILRGRVWDPWPCIRQTPLLQLLGRHAVNMARADCEFIRSLVQVRMLWLQAMW